MAAINLYPRGNEAVELNPSTTDLTLTSHGSDWLWAVFSVFSLLALIHGASYIFSGKKNVSSKKFLYISPLFTTFVFSFAYFTYASNLGWTSIEAEFNHVTVSDPSEIPGTRQIFYSKFVAWFLGLPFVLFTIEYARTAGAYTYESWEETFQLFTNLFLEVLSFESFVISLLVGSLITSTYKWGYFTFGAVSLLFGLYLLVSDHFFVSSSSSSIYLKLLIPFVVIIFILYPIAWGLSEGGNVIQPDSEAVFYGILDLILYGFVPAVIIFILPSTSYLSKSKDVEAKEIVEEPRASGDTAVEATVGENVPVAAPVAAPAAEEAV